MPCQQIQLLIDIVITLTFFSQPTAKSFHVMMPNPSFILPWKLGS
jgi:hypothetical protein